MYRDYSIVSVRWLALSALGVVALLHGSRVEARQAPAQNQNPPAQVAPPPTGASPGVPAAPGAPTPPGAAPVPPGAAPVPVPKGPPKPVEIRPYVAPRLPPEPPVEPTEIKTVEIIARDENNPEALVLARPYYPSPMLGVVVVGTRVPIKGKITAQKPRGCATRTYYALEPFGYICSRDAKPTAEPPTLTPFLSVVPGGVVPFRYVKVSVGKEKTLPMWATLEDLEHEAEPERQLKSGDTVAIAKTVKVRGQRYYISVEGKVTPVAGTFMAEDYSFWSGIDIGLTTYVPFGWVGPGRGTVMDAPRGGKRVGTLERRSRVSIYEEARVGGRRMLRIGENQWISAGVVAEVRKLARPKGTGTQSQWIDIDLGEQVLTAYEGDRPVYATLISSGRKDFSTPRGNYPIWGKVGAINMKSQPYDDEPFFVNKVPWVLFFQAHNAVHGAYWHDRFGTIKSHGCANVAPLDARHLFEWISPSLPPGWTGYRFYDLSVAPVVHVRDSHLKPAFKQERNIGPPDRDEEAARLEEALARRAEMEAQGLTPDGQPIGGPVPGQPGAQPQPGTQGQAPPPGAPAPVQVPGASQQPAADSPASPQRP